jgi:lactobin A/cerein 7B family class IIb bacteriocin
MTTKTEELTIDELNDVSGGCLPIILGALALVGGFDIGLYIGWRISRMR